MISKLILDLDVGLCLFGSTRDLCLFNLASVPSKICVRIKGDCDIPYWYELFGPRTDNMYTNDIKVRFL